MKRSRENGIPGPQVKRPAGYRAEMGMSEPSSTPSLGSAQRLTTDDALAYLKAVKDMFKDDKDKYDEFLEVMKDFKAQRIDTAGVITRVKDLFKGHRGLILGFNAFLPKGFEITLPAKDESPAPKKQPVEFDQAINYVNKIKTRFQTDEHVYKAFLEILNMYRKGNKSITDVYQEVAALFMQHADLVEEFTYFLPDSSGPAAPIPTLKPQPAPPASRSDDKAAVATQVRQMPPEKIKREKILSSHPERGDRSGAERTADGDNKPTSKLDKEQPQPQPQQQPRKRPAAEKKDDSERRERDKAATAKDAAAAVAADDGKDKDLDASQRLPHKRKSARRADELIRKQSQVGEGGEALPGQSASPHVDEDKKLSKSSSLQKEQLAFFDKVKGRLRNRDTYQEFLKCLNIFNQEIISRTELQSLVADILGKHSDLMDGFNDFLSRRETSIFEGCLANVFNNRKLEFAEGGGGGGPGGGASVRPPKAEKDKEPAREREPKDWDLEPHMEQNQERERESTRGGGFAPQKEAPCQKAPCLHSKDKYSSKPISELDLSDWERCTPSYRLLPKGYPKPLSTHRTDLARGVLNDSWVSVTSGSEDYSFKHMRKNQYEESLFRCEDDRFELDMLVESAAVTARRVSDLMDVLQNPDLKQMSPFALDDHLSAINLRCIERIYGDHGLDVIDLLRKNASMTLPVVLCRLRQKHDEWSRCRVDMNRVWAEVYSKNYHKSLDHRSFYFKQQDKKSLSTKSLIAEIKEIGDKKRRDGSTALTVVNGSRRPFVPELRFEYADPSVHEDVYQIIKYSLEEVCSTVENSEKIIRIWSKFFEPMFGVAARPAGAEDRKETTAKALRGDRKGNSVNGSEVSPNVGDGYEFESRAQQTCSGEAAKGGQDGGAQATSPYLAVTGETGDVECDVAGHQDQKPGVEEYAHQEDVQGLTKSEGQDTKQTAGRKVEGSDVPSKPLQEVEKQTEASFSTGGGKYSADALSYSLPCASSKEAVSPGEKNAALEGEGNSDTVSERRVAAAEDVEKDADARSSHRHRSEALANRNVGEVNMGSSTRAEREEGEMSPSPGPEDRNESKYGHGHSGTARYKVRDGMESTVRSQSSGHNKQDVEESEGNGDRDGDADDEGEESASENMSEDGDVSDNESGDGDDASPDDHDDEDEDEDGGHEGKGESEAEGDVDQNHCERERMSWAPSSDLLFAGCKPLPAYCACVELPPQNNTSVVYGNDSFYVIFRLHQTLYERILSAKKNAIAAEQKWKSTRDSSPPNFYAKFMRVLYSLLDGSTDNAKFEDECRTIIGTQSYILFTLDKLIFKLVKQLQAAVSDDTLNKLLVLHAYEKSRGPGRFVDLVYFANAAVLLHDDNIYRFEHKSNTSACIIQLMENRNDKHEISATALEYTFASYLNTFIASVVEDKDCHRVFLPRNKRRVVNRKGFGHLMALPDVEVVNGLEYKVTCNTSKVSYVLDTEDFFHRRKHPWRKPEGRQGHVKDAENGVPTQSCWRSQQKKSQQRFRKWFEETSKAVQENSAPFSKVRSK